MLHAPPLDSPAVQLRPPTQLPTLRIPWLYTYVYKATPAIYVIIIIIIIIILIIISDEAKSTQLTTIRHQLFRSSIVDVTKLYVNDYI